MESIAERKRDLALELYRLGQVSKSKAAEIAGISLWELMDLIEQEPGSGSYTLEQAVEDVRKIIASAKLSTQ